MNVIPISERTGSAARPVRAPLGRLGHRHEALLTMCVANPGARLGEIAKALGLTIAWCSRVYNSDMFQAELRAVIQTERERALAGLTNKLLRNTDEALDKQFARLQTGASERFIIDSTSMLLTSLGYGAKDSGERSQESHLHVHVDAETLRRARATIGTNETPLKVVGGHTADGRSAEPGAPPLDSLVDS